MVSYLNCSCCLFTRLSSNSMVYSGSSNSNNSNTRDPKLALRSPDDMATFSSLNQPQSHHHHHHHGPYGSLTTTTNMTPKHGDAYPPAMDHRSNALGSSLSHSSQPETPRSPLSARSEGGKHQEVSQVHATAINGDKQSLSRLISVSSAEDLDVGDQFGRSPLMFCVLGDRLECADMLVKAGALVNLKDKGGRTALHWAAHKGNLRFMKLLLSRGADCREKDNEGQTALHLCTRHKLPKCMALLLRQLTPGEIDDQDNSKRTALHWASSYGNLDHVKMLIKQDSNIGIPDTDGKTPLHYAASSRDREAVSCVKLILETTPSVINWQDYEGRTALHLAVADGNESVVTVLTSIKNCNVSALDNVFRTPLHWAAVLGHSKIVGLLLDSEADYTSSDSNGATPLHYAAQNNFDDTVTVFLLANCTDEPDLEGRTAFMWAAGKGADNVVRVFLNNRVDIQQDDKTGATALHAAALSGHSSTVKLLLDHGSKLEANDQVKHTPLFRACEMGHLDVVQTLIDFGARVDSLDQDGRSSLHWAALGGHAYICQILIKHGVQPNVKDHTLRAPLHCAAYGGYVNCMSVLMEHGAEPNSHDREGMTSLHWACSKGHLDAVKLLVEYHAFPNHMEFTEDRYTPLDYALMGEHHDVAQYMIEQGALSITGIQDIAALSIQSAFRGYRVRKAFTERKKLLMKHEKLKKEAARKRAAEEGKRTELGSPQQDGSSNSQQQKSHHRHHHQKQPHHHYHHPDNEEQIVKANLIIDSPSHKSTDSKDRTNTPPSSLTDTDKIIKSPLQISRRFSEDSQDPDNESNQLMKRNAHPHHHHTTESQALLSSASDTRSQQVPSPQARTPRSKALQRRRKQGETAVTSTTTTLAQNLPHSKLCNLQQYETSPSVREEYEQQNTNSVCQFNQVIHESKSDHNKDIKNQQQTVKLDHSHHHPSQAAVRKSRQRTGSSSSSSRHRKDNASSSSKSDSSNSNSKTKGMKVKSNSCTDEYIG